MQTRCLLQSKVGGWSCACMLWPYIQQHPLGSTTDSKGKKRKDKSKKTLKSGGETKRSKFMMS